VPVQRAGAGDGCPHVHAEAQRLTLCTCWLLQERSSEQAACLLVGAASSEEVFLLQPRSTLSVKVSPLDQAHLSPLQPGLLKASSGTTWVELDPARMCSHQQARYHMGKTWGVLLVQTSQHHPSGAAKVAEGKEKGRAEGRLCTGCSGVWS